MVRRKASDAGPIDQGHDEDRKGRQDHADRLGLGRFKLDDQARHQRPGHDQGLARNCSRSNCRNDNAIRSQRFIARCLAGCWPAAGRTNPDPLPTMRLNVWRFAVAAAPARPRRRPRPPRSATAGARSRACSSTAAIRRPPKSLATGGKDGAGLRHDPIPDQSLVVDPQTKGIENIVIYARKVVARPRRRARSPPASRSSIRRSASS